MRRMWARSIFARKNEADKEAADLHWGRELPIGTRLLLWFTGIWVWFAWGLVVGLLGLIWEVCP